MGLGCVGPVVGLSQTVDELGEGHTDPLEEVVDVVRVIPANLLAELDVLEELGRDVHARIVVRSRSEPLP